MLCISYRFAAESVTSASNGYEWGLQDLGQLTLAPTDSTIPLLDYIYTYIPCCYQPDVRHIHRTSTTNMSGDILHNKAARPSTVFPGHWLINLPPDTPIHIQRYRSLESTGDSREQALLEDPLEVQWRKINSTGDGNLKDILAGGCATIVHGAVTSESERERELWMFSTDGAKLEDLQSLERTS
jgi:hypothetical protein